MKTINLTDKQAELLVDIVNVTGESDVEDAIVASYPDGHFENFSRDQYELFDKVANQC